MRADGCGRAAFVRGVVGRTGVVVLALAGAVPALGAGTAAVEPEVGTTVVIERQVTGTLGTDQRLLKKGFRVHRNELLQTGPQAQAELKLDDNTKLALGPNAELRLDEFAVGNTNDAASVALKLLKGTFRFITGTRASETYKIETPSATIGVRGTVFDILIGPSGDTLILLHDGEVEVCSRARTCRRHRDVGRIVHATTLGVVSDPIKWTASLVPGMRVGRAFPFVGRRLAIDPVRRLRHAAIVAPIVAPIGKGAGRSLDGAGQSIGRTLRKVTPF